MTHPLVSLWTRRAWLVGQSRIAASLAALGIMLPRPLRLAVPARAGHSRVLDAATGARVAMQAAPLDPGPLQVLAQRAVDAARAAGARYADARLTRTVTHEYSMWNGGAGVLSKDDEMLGVGVRVLVDGYWGFAASPFWTLDDVTRLAQDAVRQATANARGGDPRVVEFAPIPVATGAWATPVRIDPFTVPIEEKQDYISYWGAAAQRAGVRVQDGIVCQFARQERVVATSEGAQWTQTVYESAGNLKVGAGEVRGLGVAGKGWELFLDAKIPEQFPKLAEEVRAQATIGGRPAALGRYTLVCDGATMAALLDVTLGLATQLDRALGYEANAGGTSLVTDPLAMVGHFSLASPVVTVTTNRSAPAQLATVKWDEEGVEPPEATVISDGVLTDFQTTREQATWLAPYYHAHGRPVRSHGCAAAQDALSITMQQQPNLALAPSATAIGLDDLVADVKEGLFIEQGWASSDFQGRNGLLGGTMRKIKDGRLGSYVVGGVIQFNTLDLWKHVTAVGGSATAGGYDVSQWFSPTDVKGQPPQYTSHSVRAVAAIVPNQALINPRSKG